jgi:hypothetical protein
MGIMNQIKFFKHCTNIGVYYDCGKMNGVLDNLTFFLSTEVTCFDSFSWIQFLDTAEDGDETSGNLMTIEKRGNDVYIGNVYYEGPEGEQNYFIISKSQLTKLMVEWERLMKEMPDVIILSAQSGNFELVGENYSKNMLYEEMTKIKK